MVDQNIKSNKNVQRNTIRLRKAEPKHNHHQQEKKKQSWGWKEKIKHKSSKKIFVHSIMCALIDKRASAKEGTVPHLSSSDRATDRRPKSEAWSLKTEDWSLKQATRTAALPQRCYSQQYVLYSGLTLYGAGPLLDYSAPWPGLLANLRNVMGNNPRILLHVCGTNS